MRNGGVAVSHPPDQPNRMAPLVVSENRLDSAEPRFREVSPYVGIATSTNSVGESVSQSATTGMLTYDASETIAWSEGLLRQNSEGSTFDGLGVCSGISDDD